MSNPLTNEIKSSLPGITISLPSGGKFYPNGVLSSTCNPMALEIRPVSIIDEINFRDPYKIISGTAINELVARTCKDILLPGALFKVDVDLIMIASRAASHGPILETKVTCSNTIKKEDNTEVTCGAESEVKVDLNRVMIQFQSVGTLEDWALTFPNGQIAQMRPIPYSSVVHGLKEMSEHAKIGRRLELQNKDKDLDAIEDAQKNSLDKIAKLQVKLIVDSIDYVRTASGQNINDRVMIYEWLAAMPSDWVIKVNNMMNEKAKIIDSFSEVQFTCPSCKMKKPFPLSLDPTSFFSHGSQNSNPSIKF
jgi:hypothetical protein